MLDDFVAGSAAEAGDEAGTAGVVVGVAPVGWCRSVWDERGRQGGDRYCLDRSGSHTSLLNGRGVDVQRRILIR